MKAFDKWWKKYKYEGILDYEEYFKCGWEEALEFALTMVKEDIYAGDAFNKAYHIPDWAVDKIEKELEEKDELNE